MEFQYLFLVFTKQFILYSVIISKFLFSNSVLSLSSKELCMNKICSGCIAHSLSCQEGGLQQIPDSLSTDITSMILMGHHFTNPTLSRENFSLYVYQEVKLQRLTLRNCAIQFIESATFEALKHLQQLDLSQNKIQFIQGWTFKNLNLDFLRLDENVGLNFHPDAFQNVKIESLSINQCGLTSLNYKIIEPLVKTKHLTNLHLTGNQLITLESHFEPLFSQLESISIDQNPFNCDCKLNWLANWLHQKQLAINQHQTKHPYSNKSRNKNQQNPFYLFLETKSNMAALDEDLLKPVCRNPRRLNGRTIESLDSFDFYCDTPKLEKLEIDLSELNYLDLKNKEIHELKTILKCQMKGSPELQVDWYSLDSKKQISQLFIQNTTHLNPHLLTRLPSTKQSGTKMVELKLLKQLDISLNRTKSLETNNWPSNYDRLICFGSDSNGNLSAKITIRWPKFLNKINSIEMDNQVKSGVAFVSKKHKIEKLNNRKSFDEFKTKHQATRWYNLKKNNDNNSFLFQVNKNLYILFQFNY